ncbi:RagB/SusD family nutrient uptake outer membrane protein [Parafilimonas terrae]|uniref:Starch-binding associating with outer membrane n=1 Tax=Parafilimonas terrae TaxID=1465490 RepID=A0A1I5YZ48_9BACT|nr:RagB/SusD family nutrient uptake outer membrane protein [Parafilimonas terrae]SFQ49553.1 Starch-binding associating with outer membrane [Parafilimonas terrae]
MNRFKSLYKVLACILIIGLYTGCTKLKDKSGSVIISDQFNPTAEDIPAITGAAYTYWRQVLLLWDGLWRAQELSADQEVIPARPNGWVDGGVYKRIHQHVWTADEGIVVNTWSRTYAGITTCNRIIYQIENNLIPITDSSIKHATIAEIKVLRASYYYILCDFFGNVPIVTQFDLPTGYLPEQNTRKEVYDFIIKEITDNISLLSTDNSAATYGTFNQWAAHTLLAKMYLNAEVYTGTPAWDKCIEECNAVINSGAGYMLEPDQKNVFATENENSKEIIFGLAIDSKYTTDWNAFDLHMQSLEPENQKTYNLMTSPWGGMCAIPQFINSFDADDSRVKNNWIQGQQYESNGSILIGSLGAYSGKPLAYINEVPNIDASEEVHGYRLGKFEIAMGSAVQLDNDFPLFRYADILMMKAECLLRTGHADEAAALVTQVRERAFKDNPSKATVTAADLMKGSHYNYGLRSTLNTTEEGGADIKYGRMLDELGWEFDQEGRRRQDMIRFGAFTAKSWFDHKASDANKALFPIPRTELEKNSNLKQNPGY